MNEKRISDSPNIAQATQSGQPEELTDGALLEIFYYNAEEWAMEVLYERYKRYVYILAYRIVGNSFLAEDIVQEVFLTIWQKAFFYHEQQGSFKGWLQAIVRNRALDKVRSCHARYTHYVPPQELNQMALASPDPELWEQAWESEQTMYIRRALLQLPPAQRLAIELNYFAGYTHAEIAKRLQLTLGTVKGRLRLGMQKMRLLLQEYGVDM